MKKETYNGWTNYETWKVMLELFDGHEVEGPIDADYCEELAWNIVTGWKELEANPLADFSLNYAASFLSNVNWYEIAEAVNDYNKEL